MKRPLQSFTAVLFGILLVTAAVTTGIAPSPVGTAEADPWVDTCVVGVTPLVDFTGNICPDAKTESLEAADADETEVNLYESAATQKNNVRVLHQSYMNYLEDTKNTARLIGKNAYIKALNNGSSEASARVAAREAIQDYYTVKQKQLIKSWNITVRHAAALEQTAEDTQGVADNFINLTVTTSGHSTWGPRGGDIRGTTNETVELLNGTEVGVVGLKADVWFHQQSGERVRETGVFHFENRSTVLTWPSSNSASVYPEQFFVQTPSSDFQSPVYYGAIQTYFGLYDRIEKQNSAVQADLNAFINATYESYQQGEISTPELVDPYLGARYYSPANESFQSWSLLSMSRLGIDPPSNLSNIGQMVVRSGGVNHTGILMSETHPTDGFEVGSTYNATELNGSQFVATQNGSNVRLQGEFTLLSATTADGETYGQNETIIYKDVNYGTANISQYRELMDQIQLLKAKINSRQQRLRNAGGGWLNFGGIGFGGGLGVPVTILLLAGAAVLLLDRN